MTERDNSFTVISIHMIILSGIKGIQHGQEDLRDDVVSNYRGVFSYEITVKNLFSGRSTPVDS